MTLSDMIEQMAAVQHDLACIGQDFPELRVLPRFQALDRKTKRVLETMMQMRRGYMTPKEVTDFQKELDDLRNGAI